MSPYRVQVQCHGNDQGEVWSVQLLQHDAVIATVTGLPHPAAARQAGEFLLFGALSEWIPNLIARDDMYAGIVPLLAPSDELVEDPDGADVDIERVNAIVDAIWQACARRLYAEAAAG
jgi:hypothetical protein